MKKRLPSAQKDRVGAKETNARKRKGQAESPALSFAAALFIPFGPVVHFAEQHSGQKDFSLCRSLLYSIMPSVSKI